MNETSSFKLLAGLSTLILVLVGVLYLLYTQKWKKVPFFKQPTVITEKVTIPDTKQIGGSDGFYANKQAHKVPLAPTDDGERVIVTGAVHSPYTSYDLVRGRVADWAGDAKLAIIKSLGTVTLEGTSSGWQLIFVSKTKGSGYEVIVENDVVMRMREIPTEAKGGEVPDNFKDRDASWAIARLSENPQWKGAVMTGLNLAYNADAKAWDYIIANSYGGSAVRVR